MKLLAVFLVVSLLPLILLGLTSSVIMKKYEKNLSLRSASEIAGVTSEHLTNYFSGLKNAVETAAANDNVKYAVKDNNEAAKNFLQGLVSSYPSIQAVVIMDLEGSISPSSLNTDILENYDDFTADSISSDIKNSIGLSGLSEYNDIAMSDGAIVFSKYIRSENENIGTISFFIDFSYLNSCIGAGDSDGLNQLMICDWNGNIYISQQSGVRYYEDVKEFAGLKSTFENMSLGKMYGASEYKYDDHNKAIQYATVSMLKNSSGRHWNVVVVTNIDAIVSRYKDLTSSIQSSIFAISIIDIVLIMLFIAVFLRPIGNAMRILGAGEINVSSQRVLVNGSTELDHLNRQINLILDMLSESEQRYRNIVDMTDNIIFEYSVKKDAFTFSDNYNKKFSYRAKSEKYEDSFFVNATVYPEDEDAYKTFVTSATEGNSVQGEFRFKTIYNDYAWYLVRSASIRDSYNSIIKIVGVMINIDKTKSREQTLMNKASLDPLTQAYNRESFEMSLLNEFELSEMRKGKDAVLFIDLDDFKHFNDEYNHTLGDEVLVFTVNTAKKLVGKNGFVGRFGGDEFVICFRETDEMDSSVLAQRIISTLSSGFDAESSSEHIVMFCSIGIAYITPEDSDPAAVIDRADQAMYSVKKSGKSNYAIYSSALGSKK